MVALITRLDRQLTLDRIECVVHAITASLLAPTLLTAFLSMEPSDGAFDFSVAERLLRGEQLYRDLEFFSTPLSVYWNALLLDVLPRSMVTVSMALLMSCLLIGFALARFVYRGTGGDWSVTALLFFAVMYMGVYRWPRASYSWNAVLFVVLGAVLLTPEWRGGAEPRRVPRARLFWTGVMFGAATGFKQSIGVPATAAVMLSLVYVERPRADRSLATLIARGGVFTFGATLVPTVVILDLYLKGQLPRFIDVVYGRSRQYVRGMRLSYLSNFALPNSYWSVPNWVLEQAMLVVLVLGLFVCTALALGLLFSPAAIRRACGRSATAGREPVVMLWALLYLASFVSVFPRADYAHVTFAIPLCLTALCVFARPLIVGGDDKARRTRQRIAVVACLALSVLMTAKLGYSAFALATGRLVFFPTYPARGMITTSQMLDMFSEIHRAIREALPDDDPLLIADRSGCFLYSFLGRRPPTSNVYFYARMVGENDLADLVQRIESGRIRGLLIPAPESDATAKLVPLYVGAARTMEFRTVVGNFHLFVRR